MSNWIVVRGSNRCGVVASGTSSDSEATGAAEALDSVAMMASGRATRLAATITAMGAGTDAEAHSFAQQAGGAATGASGQQKYTDSTTSNTPAPPIAIRPFTCIIIGPLLT